MKFREFKLRSGSKIFLGRDAENNDLLMKKFEGKENIILHTNSPGSPFGVIDKIEPSKEDIQEGGIIVASYSQDWRDNRKNVLIDVFTGKDTSKPKGYKIGSWKVKRAKKIRIKKEDILQLEKEKNGTRTGSTREKRNNR
ncbi:MAG: NFACT RNA binding domain-containing protein [Candidatus Pacearchaeota archaeon]